MCHRPGSIGTPNGSSSKLRIMVPGALCFEKLWDSKFAIWPLIVELQFLFKEASKLCATQWLSWKCTPLSVDLMGYFIISWRRKERLVGGPCFSSLQLQPLLSVPLEIMPTMKLLTTCKVCVFGIQKATLTPSTASHLLHRFLSVLTVAIL